MSVTPIPSFYCQCDPEQVAGRPGIACRRCGGIRPRREVELLRHVEDANALRQAADLLDAVSGDGDLCAEDGLANLAKAERQIHRVLGYIHTSQHELIDELCDQRRQDNERGRPTIGVVGARDQSPGRPR